ncbi:transcriptional regulator, MerR family [Lachnospiraceae bacterium KM106-2]|nr:transcriptional regulator, MerR family [Lachnospiraceae bacterium KM106-2]
MVDSRETLYQKLGINEEFEESKSIQELFEKREKEIEETRFKQENQKWMMKKILKDQRKNRERDPKEYEKMLDQANTIDDKTESKDILPLMGGSIVLLIFMIYPFLLVDLKEWDMLYLAIGVAIIATGALVLLWQYCIHKFGVKAAFRYTLKGIVAFTGILALTMLLFVGVEQLQKQLFVPEDYILFQMDKPYRYLPFLVEVEIGGFILWRYLAGRKKFNRVLCIAILVINIAVGYIMISGVTVCTTSEIILHTFWNPRGHVIAYEDVKAVDAGFDPDGEFYYKMTLKKGKVIEITQAVSDRYPLTYQEYQELDKIVMDQEHKPLKETSTRYIQDAQLDQEYLELLRAVLKNK